MVPLRLACAIRDAELAAAVQCCLRGLPVRIILDQNDLQSFARQLRGLRPDVALIEVGEAGEPGEWVGRVKSGPDGPMVIVIDKAANPAAILSAFRAGADEFLYPPLEDNLRHALERESDRLRRRTEASGPRGKILAFTSVKGGCGATTLACATAMELARHDQRGVALLDLDFSCSLTGFLTGVRSAYSVTDAIFNCHRLDLDYWNALVSKGPEGIDVLPARIGNGPRRETDTESLRHVLRFARQQYGWVVVDLGTAQESFWAPTADELDLLLLVTTVDVMALYRCVRTLRDLEERGVPRNSLRSGRPGGRFSRHDRGRTGEGYRHAARGDRAGRSRRTSPLARWRTHPAVSQPPAAQPGGIGFGADGEVGRSRDPPASFFRLARGVRAHTALPPQCLTLRRRIKRRRWLTLPLRFAPVAENAPSPKSASSKRSVTLSRW